MREKKQVEERSRRRRRRRMNRRAAWRYWTRIIMNFPFPHSHGD